MPWDNYTRALVLGWWRRGLSAETIAERWPWPHSRPSAYQIRKLLEQQLGLTRRGVAHAEDIG